MQENNASNIDDNKRKTYISNQEHKVYFELTGYMNSVTYFIISSLFLL